MSNELKRIAHELRTYNPAADEYKGEHIHKVWAREIEAALSDAQAPIGEVVDFRETAFASIPVIAWESKPELGAKLYAAPVPPAAAVQSDETNSEFLARKYRESQPDERAAKGDEPVTFSQWFAENCPEFQRQSYSAADIESNVRGMAYEAWNAVPQPTHYQELIAVAYVVLGCLSANGIDIPERFLDAFRDPDSVDNPTDLLPCDFLPAQAVVAAMPSAPIYQIGANAGGGIAWWDVDKDRYEREKKAGYMKTCVVYREK